MSTPDQDPGAEPGAELDAVPELVISDVRPWGHEACDLVVHGTTITDVVVAGGAPPAARVVDGRGLLALPGVVNAHAHVDKSWWGLPWQSWDGEPGVAGRIAHERARRDELGIPGLEITSQVLGAMVRHGTTAIRTHVDVDLGLGLRGLEVVQEAAAAYDGALTVETVAFPQDGVLRRPGVLELLDRAAAAGADHVGGLDPATIDRDPVGQLDGVLEIAARHGCGADLHLHDPAELGAFTLELLLERVERLGLQGRVTVAHGFAVADLEPVRRRDLLQAMGELGVSMTTVAPVGRPQLPVAELDAAGVALGLGTDGIRDLWSPYGTGDTLHIGWQLARAGGLVRDEDLARVVELATRDGARFVSGALDGAVLDLVPGGRADVVLLDAENVMDALVRLPPRSLVVGGGRVLHES